MSHANSGLAANSCKEALSLRFNGWSDPALVNHHLAATARSADGVPVHIDPVPAGSNDKGLVLADNNLKAT
eukprot:1449447-Prymnesium_polylepis.2